MPAGSYRCKEVPVFNEIQGGISKMLSYAIKIRLPFCAAQVNGGSPPLSWGLPRLCNHPHPIIFAIKRVFAAKFPCAPPDKGQLLRAASLDEVSNQPFPLVVSVSAFARKSWAMVANFRFTHFHKEVSEVRGL